MILAQRLSAQEGVEIHAALKKNWPQADIRIVEGTIWVADPQKGKFIIDYVFTSHQEHNQMIGFVNGYFVAKGWETKQ